MLFYVRGWREEEAAARVQALALEETREAVQHQQNETPRASGRKREREKEIFIEREKESVREKGSVRERKRV